MTQARQQPVTRIKAPTRPAYGHRAQELAETGWSGEEHVVGSGYLCGSCREPLPVGGLVCSHCGTPIAFEEDAEPGPAFDEPGDIAGARAKDRVLFAHGLTSPARNLPSRTMLLGIATAVVLLLAGFALSRRGTVTEVTGGTGAGATTTAAPVGRAALVVPTTTTQPTTTTLSAEQRTTAFCAATRKYPFADVLALAREAFADAEGTYGAYKQMQATVPDELQGYVEAMGPVTEQAYTRIKSGEIVDAAQFQTWLAASPDLVLPWIEAQQKLVPAVQQRCP